MTDEVASILPIVPDGPRPPEQDDNPLPKPQRARGDIPPVVRPQEPTGVVQPDPLYQGREHGLTPEAMVIKGPSPVARYQKPDPWANVPVDTYWFGRTWSRSPNPDEYREWEFELVTTDNRGQRNRLLARVDGPFSLALDRVKAGWEEQLGANVRADKIMVLSS